MDTFGSAMCPLILSINVCSFSFKRSHNNGENWTFEFASAASLSSSEQISPSFHSDSKRVAHAVIALIKEMAAANADSE